MSDLSDYQNYGTFPKKGTTYQYNYNTVHNTWQNTEPYETNWHGSLIFMGVLFAIIFTIVLFCTMRALLEDIHTKIQGNYRYNLTGKMPKPASVPTYNSSVVTATNYNGLRPGEREKPPRSTTFGIINGEHFSRHGHYEEWRLNNFELSVWKRQKERKEAKQAGLVDEIEPLTPEQDLF